MSNEQNTPEPRDYRTGHGQTAYKRALAYKNLGINPASVPCVPFFRASLTRIGRSLNHPRIKPEPHARLIRPFDCLQVSDDPDACKVSSFYRSVPDSYRRLLPPEAFCIAAGVDPIRGLELITGSAARQTGQASALMQRDTHLSPSTVNCGLRTLRRALYLAAEWGKLNRKPKITFAKGERQRDRVLTDVEVGLYLEACEQPWRDAATVMLGTGMRPGEVFSLRWENVLLKGSRGLLQITDGKSKAARRMLPLVPAVYSTLKGRQNGEKGWVFPAATESGHLEGGSAKNYNARALAAIKKAAAETKIDNPLKPLPPYTMRHTALTRLADAGCDAITLARIAGHSSITITQRYCHPQADAIERAFAKLSDGEAVVTDGGQRENRIGTQPRQLTAAK